MPASTHDLSAQFRKDVLVGLSQPQKVIPARWFYDLRGSELFEQITSLPEYYPTRTEIGIFRECCPKVADLVGPGRVVVEFGAGSAAKTPLLLDAIAPGAYVPVDISGEFLRESCVALAERYPDLPIIPVEADFLHPFPLPAEAGQGCALGFFPGSTIGNMTPAPAVDLLRSMRASLGDDAMLLIGMDLIKDEQRLVAAYDDAQGVTAEFNRNLAARINRELGGTLPLDSLDHVALWNEPLARIEMHLRATRDIAFEVCGEPFSMREGETIHTENSHKYSPTSADLLLLAGRWEPVAHYFDKEHLFMVVLARAISTDMTA
ncbi:MAG: L-histidine N(alpha)-methyltransferase [Novosphingobium sp.]|nr:L-histidine N(alpha)-methyltransferase [Novosphingobium sp.]